MIVAERDRIAREVGALGWLDPYPSEANFVLFRVGGGACAAEIAAALRARGVLVRHYDRAELAGTIRISAGRPQDTDRLLAALKEVGPRMSDRRATITRKTAETTIEVTVDLDGSGQFAIETGLGFFDHMLSHIAKHGVFDVSIKASGDLHVDAHHTVEDVGIALGEAFAEALGDKAGIVRAGSSYMPLDEALGFAAVDLSGRPYTVVDLGLLGREVGGLPPDLFAHALESFAASLRANLHVRALAGVNDHHKAEACFKALARALDAATRTDPRRGGDVPSTKGSL